MPPFDGGDDFVGVGGPCEGFWHLVCLDDEAVDGGLEVDDGSEDPALQSSLGQFGEEALDRVEPRTRGRREVQAKAFVPVEPRTNLGMLVRSIVVENDVNGFLGWDLRLDGVEEADEFLMAVAL